MCPHDVSQGKRSRHAVNKRTKSNIDPKTRKKGIKLNPKSVIVSLHSLYYMTIKLNFMVP